MQMLAKMSAITRLLFLGHHMLVTPTYNDVVQSVCYSTRFSCCLKQDCRVHYWARQGS